MTTEFAVFILTYGRPEKVVTYKTLRKAGYTGDIYLVCSTDDKSIPKYKEIYKDKVVTFNKDDYVDKFDIGDNFDDKRVVVYARNAIFDIVNKLDVNYFLVLDDDYTSFNFRFNDKLNYAMGKTIKRNLDYIFTRIKDYFKTIPAKSIALSQGGDFIGGQYGGLADKIKIKRKIMNTFFCAKDRPFKFIGRINEDVNTYVHLGNIGELVFQTNQLAVEQITTQANSGGLTEFYLDTGTYIKSYYTVMFAPSCVKINKMGNVFKRLHHKVLWNNTCPKIIREENKK